MWYHMCSKFLASCYRAATTLPPQISLQRNTILNIIIQQKTIKPLNQIVGAVLPVPSLLTLSAPLNLFLPPFQLLFLSLSLFFSIRSTFSKISSPGYPRCTKPKRRDDFYKSYPRPSVVPKKDVISVATLAMATSIPL